MSFINKIFTLLFLIASLYSNAQLTIQNPLLLKTLVYTNSEQKIVDYSFTTTEKKVFLFYDIKTEALAEVMYNGSEYVFDKTAITVFPIFFTGDLKKKKIKSFLTKIPTQYYRSPMQSVFKKFNITETDLPIFVLYDEQNKLCGIAKTTEQVNEIDCDENYVKSRFLRLKILTEDENNTQKPYADKQVFIIGAEKKDTIAKLITNKYGDFETQLPNLKQDYLVKVNEKNPNVKFALLAAQTGKIIGNFTATDEGFVYKILKIELLKMPDIAFEDDIELKFKTKSSQTANEFNLTENLFYELGENTLTNISKVTLDKIIRLLNIHKTYNLTVTSHTDSQGQSEQNLKLSTQRSQEVVKYLIKKGINKLRLTADGKGESQVRNRCVDAIDCSDKEHEYNRRTEFKFIKL